MLALKIAVFLLTLSLGIVASALGRIEVREEAAPEPTAVDHSQHPSMYVELPTGAGGTNPSGKRESRQFESLPGDEVRRSGSDADSKGPKITTPLKVIYKQKAEYTAEARAKGIDGTVTLRVTFLASGEIGGITTIRGLPFGLTEQAIEAVRKMRFEPEKVDGRPRTTSRPVSFTFNLY